MRKGYWKTLLRRLRGRVASGLDTFTSEHVALTIAEILASDDDILDPTSELPLAATTGSAMLLIDTGDNRVMLRAADAACSEPTGLDLPAFIDALAAGKCKDSEMGLSMDDTGLLDLPMPARDPLLGD
jgi:hypothetical protein